MNQAKSIIRAGTENLFLLKYLIIGLVCVGFFLWSTYDAFVGYPSQLPRGEAWKKLLDDESLDDAQRQSKWGEIAKEKGWSSNRPSKDEMPKSVHEKIIWNYVFMAISLAIAVPCIFLYLSNMGTWIEYDGSVLRNSKGQELNVSTITKIDKKRWEKKGIAIVHYSGKEGDSTFIIDDLKYERKPTDEILGDIESQVDPSMIVNGPPERPLEEPETSSQEKQED